MRRKRVLANGRSSRWAFLDRFAVPDYDDPSRDYLTRWRLLRTPLFGVYLHRITGPDPRPTLHDHPWPFAAIVLRGGYIEHTLDRIGMDTVERRVRALNVKRRGDAHYIIRLLRRPTWTLLFVGREDREWGYIEPAAFANGRITRTTWTAYYDHPHAAEFDAALAARRTYQGS